MEDLHRMKKKIIVDFESKLSFVGKKLTKELENRYIVDRELVNNNYFNICFKLDKMENVNLEDKKKIKDFIGLFYYLENIKSMNY